MFAYTSVGLYLCERSEHMKRLSALLVAILPLIYIGAMECCHRIRISDEVFFAILGGYTLVGILFPILFSIVSAKAEGKFLAACNVWFYAGNLAVLAAQTVHWLIKLKEIRIAEQNGAMEGGLGLVLTVVFLYFPHWISYLFTRISGAISCSRALKGICRQEVRIIHTVLQLFVLTDLLSGIWVYCKCRRIPTQTNET